MSPPTDTWYTRVAQAARPLQRRVAHRTNLIVAGLLLLHGVLAWQSRAVGIETGLDDAWYLLLARSLRDLNYSDQHLLGAPAHVQYPPGFPALIAFVSLVFGERVQFLLAIVVLCSVAALVLLYDAVRRCSGTAVALLVLALCAVNPDLVEYAGKLMSETPFLLWTMLAVWAFIRSRSGDRPTEVSAGWAIAAGAAAIVAAMTRTFGVTLIAALGIAWLLERRLRRAATFAVAASLSVGGWMAWTIVAPDKRIGQSYVVDALFREPGQNSMVAALVDRVLTNVTYYAARSVPSAIPQPTVQGTSIDNVVGLMLLILLGGGGAWMLWKQARIVVLYLAASFGLLAIWTWSLHRFTIPLIPFIVWMLASGAFALSTKRRWLRPLPLVLALAVVAAALPRHLEWLQATFRCDRRSPQASRGCFAPAQQGLFEAAVFARDSTPRDAVFFAIRHATFAYLSDRRILHPTMLRSGDARAFIAELRTRGVDYAVVSPLITPNLQRVPWLVENCERLQPVREFRGSTFVVRVAPPSDHGGPDACAHLQRYVRTNDDRRVEVFEHPRSR